MGRWRNGICKPLVHKRLFDGAKVMLFLTSRAFPLILSRLQSRQIHLVSDVHRCLLLYEHCHIDREIHHLVGIREILIAKNDSLGYLIALVGHYIGQGIMSVIILAAMTLVFLSKRKKNA